MSIWNRQILDKHLNEILNNDFCICHEKYRGYFNSIPKKYYKYRSFKNIHLKALKEDYIWLSLAADFLDKSDSTIDFNFKKQTKRVERVIEEEMPEVVLEQIKREVTRKGKINPSIFKDITLEGVLQWLKEYKYKSGGLKINKVRTHLHNNGMHKKQIDDFEKRIKEVFTEENKKEISRNVIKKFSEINSRFRELYYIHCFAGSYDNPALWDTYTDKEQGFCIEYDISSICENVKAKVDCSSRMLPIMYTALKEIKMDELIKIAIKNHLKKENSTENHLFSVKVFSHLLTKDPRYSFENEWRLIIDKNKVSNNCFSFPFVTAIYLGANIKEMNKKIMISIAREKNIGIYQRQRNQLNTGYDFIEL